MELIVQIKLTVRIKPTNDSRPINRRITNKLIQDLFSYLSHFYLTTKVCLLYYLVFQWYRWFSYSIWFFASCNVLSFVNINCFINYNIHFLSATISYLLSMLTASSAAIFNSLSAAMSGITLFCLC